MPTLADETGIAYSTVQRIMAGNSPTTMGELEAIAIAVNIPALELFDRALKKADRDEMSAAASKPVSLDTERDKRRAATKPDDALGEQKRVAKKPNTQLGEDEPQTP